MPANEHDALLLLSLAPGLGPTLTRRCLTAMGSAQSVLDAPVSSLAQIQGLSQTYATRIRTAIDKLIAEKALQREKDLMAAKNIWTMAVDDPQYPPLLKLISDPPPLLFARGTILPSDRLSLAVVGSRHCSTYGREQADRLSAACAQAGICIISGGARGIDTAAHRAALRLGGRTIAVIGSGLAKPYPPDNAELFDQIAQQGLMLSELPMTAPPLAQNFPSRNRIVSGMSLAVLVIEAAERSGALITARLAAEDHNREVMAIPGRIDQPMSAGCHKMIRQGWAQLITTAADIFETLEESSQLLKAADEQSLSSLQPTTENLFATAAQNAVATAPPKSSIDALLSDTQKNILAALDETLDLDHLLTATNLPIPRLQADLTLLQLRGLIRKESKGFSRKR